MTNVIIVVLTLAYILVAFIAPVVAVGASIYWAYTSYDTGGSLGASILIAIISALVLLIALSFLKRGLKRVMNKVDLGEDNA